MAAAAASPLGECRVRSEPRRDHAVDHSAISIASGLTTLGLRGMPARLILLASAYKVRPAKLLKSMRSSMRAQDWFHLAYIHGLSCGNLAYNFDHSKLGKIWKP